MNLNKSFLILLLTLLLKFHYVLSVYQNGSFCVNPSSGARMFSGMGNCTTGEVWLLGNYLNLGIHNCASFGTKTRLGASYYPKQLGFIANYMKTGFGTPPNPSFAGDYFIPGSPYEGKIMLSLHFINFHPVIY